MTPHFFKFTHYLGLCLLISFGCSNSSEPVPTLGDYDIPINDSTTAMIYTYVSYPYADTLNVRYEFRPSPRGRKRVEYHSRNGLMHSERCYEISGDKKKFLWEFYHEYPGRTSNQIERIPGEIRTFCPIDDGKKYPGLQLEIAFTNSSGFRTVVEETDSYERDTTVYWKGQRIEAIKFRNQSSTSVFIKYFPLRSNDYAYWGSSLYAKGIGLIRYTDENDEEKISWKLVSIVKE